MKKIIISCLCLLITFVVLGQSKKELLKQVEQLKSKVAELEAKPTIDMNDPLQKLSYAMGISIGTSISAQVEKIDTEAFEQALIDVAEGQEKMNANDANIYIQTELKRLMEEKGAKSKAAGEAFLKENGARPEVVTLPSGLQYEILQEGNGEKPTRSDRVTVHYKGYFIDGKTFDSSIERGEPATFGVTQVIAGWTEALQLMPTGSKWKLFIPYNLAYGENGKMPTIPAYSALIFEVELIKIEGK